METEIVTLCCGADWRLDAYKTQSGSLLVIMTCLKCLHVLEAVHE